MASQPDDSAALSDLALLVYDDLRGLARHYMRGERDGHTLQPTAVVHEAYLRLNAATRMKWRGRTHFFATAAREMRRVLVDHARKVRSRKRGGSRLRVSLAEHHAVGSEPCVDVMALDEALSRLEALHPRQARVADLRLFAGLTSREVAEALGIALRTSKQDWAVARAWLAMVLDSGVSPRE